MWGPPDIGDLSGVTAMVTGGSSGVGFEAAVELAAHGARVVLGCSDRDKGVEAADLIALAAPFATVEVAVVDLGELASVRRAASALSARHDRLDILVFGGDSGEGDANAPDPGPGDAPRSASGTVPAGWRGAHHLGRFALTGLLLDLLLTTAGSRVVTVGSVLDSFARRRPPQWRRTGGLAATRNRTEPATLLAAPARAGLLFTAELQRRLDAAGAGTIAVAAHPGWIRNGGAGRPGPGRASAPSRLKQVGRRLIGRSPVSGALPVLFAATDRSVRGGHRYGPAGPFELFGPPGALRVGRWVRSGDAARLWRLSEDLTGVRFDLPSRATPS